MIEVISSLIIPAVIIVTAVLMFMRKDAFDAFVRGAAEGMHTAVGILPIMVLLMTSLAMFNASGAAELTSRALTPVCSALGIPQDIIPLAVTRPVSGSASTASFMSLLEASGADSLAGFAASILMGSSDTVIYVMGIYFGKTRVKHAVRAMVISSVTAVLCLFLSSLLARLFFY